MEGTYLKKTNHIILLLEKTISSTKSLSIQLINIYLQHTINKKVKNKFIMDS